MKRTIIKIDENLCNGCGNCVTGCHEGALQLINGKAVMVSELFCDGLGACIGDCPVNAITLEEREAEAYSEAAVMERISQKGENVIIAHLKHLKDHGEKKLLNEGLSWLKEHNVYIDLSEMNKQEKLVCGCSGSHEKSWGEPEVKIGAGLPNKPSFEACKTPDKSGFTVMKPVFGGSISNNASDQPSELRQFPVQLHLINPQAQYFENANVLLAADCTAFSVGNFHSKFLKDRKLVIACPKLDSNTDRYIEKLQIMIDETKIDTLTVLIMEVPCCSGLVGLVKKAREISSRNVPVKVIVVSVKGEVKSEQWI